MKRKEPSPFQGKGAVKMKLSVERLTIPLITIILIAILLGLNVNVLPSKYSKDSYNYGKDKRIELYLYKMKIGDFIEGPHGSWSRDNILLRLKYREGPYTHSHKKVTEIKRLGFLVPLLPYKSIFILLILLICAVSLSPAKDKFMHIIRFLTIKLYGLSLISIGICGAVFTPEKMSRDIANASFGGLILAPIYLLVWLSYIIAIIPGIFILLRKRWAIILGIIAQTILIFGFPFLLKVMIEPSDWKMPGYRIEILNPLFYSIGYLLLVLFMIWFFTRPKTKELFKKRDY